MCYAVTMEKHREIADWLINEINTVIYDKKCSIDDIATVIVGRIFVAGEKYGDGFDREFYDAYPATEDLFEIATQMEWAAKSYNYDRSCILRPFEEFKRQVMSGQNKKLAKAVQTK